MNFFGKVLDKLHTRVATPRPVVQRIDHVVIETSEPKALFELLTGPLEFPVMWGFESYDRYDCAGVYVGNTTLEILRWKASNRLGATPPGTIARPQGLAIEPSDLEYALHECRIRGIRFDEPHRQSGIDAEGVEGVIYTNVLLPGLFEKSDIAFFCDYSAPIKARRRKKIEAYGPIEDRALGVVGLTEVTFSQKSPASITPLWRRFMLPDKTAPGDRFQLEHVTVRIAPESEGPGYLRFRVASLPKTMDCLQKLGFKYTQSGDGEVWAEPSAIGGLRIFFH